MIGALSDRNTQLRLEALAFVRLCLTNHEPQEAQVLVEPLLPSIVSCSESDWYKLVAEALRVFAAVVRSERSAVSCACGSRNWRWWPASSSS